MKIKDVHVEGFGVWSGLTVHALPEGMTLFYGPNEAGKTTLMQFLRTVFYGFTPDRRRKYLPPVYGGKPGGILRVQGPGGVYEIKRRADLDADNSLGNLTVTDSEGMQHGHHRLSMLLGQMDESVFTNVFAIGLRELQELSTLDDTAAADELYKLSSGLDRVSLVDVLRQLRAARQQLIDPASDRGQLQRLVQRRQELKKELEQLVETGRRWTELAALRTGYRDEVEQLKERIEQWQLEVRQLEMALQVRPVWVQRQQLMEQINALGARTDLPEDLWASLEEVNGELATQRQHIAELIERRRQLRERARGLQLQPGILELQAKIEAAAEHEPWLIAMQKNIARLRQQIEDTQIELMEAAQRLGMAEEDQQALLEDRRASSLPDLSRQALSQLMEPANEVRMWSTRLKQARHQAEADRQEAERLKAEIDAAMESRKVKDIHAAIEAETELIHLLRKRIQVEESLEKLRSRLDQLEEEAIDLQCDEALPVERSFLMGILFVAGAFSFLWGLGKLLPFFNPDGVTDQHTGLLLVLSGMFLLFFGLMWTNVLDRNTVSELDEAEEKIEAIRKEIRKLEAERDELERRLPAYQGSPESRLREAEKEVKELESLLPVWHNYRAAMERHQSARRRASKAEEALRSAQLKWKQALAHMGLSDTLSPKSIRALSEGYENLILTRRRLRSLEEELETRRAELKSIVARIEALAEEAFAGHSADGKSGSHKELASAGAPNKEERKQDSRAAAESVADDDAMAARALQLLAKLQALITSQRQAIAQKKRLREEDRQLAKQIEVAERALRKLERRRDALLAEYECETEDQLRELIARKQRHHELQEEIEQLNQQLRAMIGGQYPFDQIIELLQKKDDERLNRELNNLRRQIQQAEERIGQLNQRLGETQQEMKALAADTRQYTLKLELEALENQIAACIEQWQTLATTTWLLDRVCEVYEAERQPETLREASRFLKQLTEGKYTRIWTPLGKNQLKVDNAHGQSLPLEVLSRGTREAVFIALRLSLAAAYARRGVQIPLVLDDVLVNFDTQRAEAAARVLRDFAELGHQVLMFTCHEHIMKMFYDIGVQVRVLPDQGHPGEAEVYHPLAEQFERIEQLIEMADPPADTEQQVDDAEVAVGEEGGADVVEEAVVVQPAEVGIEVADESDTADRQEESEEVAAAKDAVAEEVATEPPETSAVESVKQEEKQEAAPPRVAKPPRRPEPPAAPHRPEIDWLWFERSPDEESDWDGSSPRNSALARQPLASEQ
ncbi:MAG: hypothetical protein KatS3mg111_1517 [Pirellulaceae bacterium]|nr:MAG: hypothetical protein KatS3mg111_1517 [Pirellulaceae bacterium]